MDKYKLLSNLVTGGEIRADEIGPRTSEDTPAPSSLQITSSVPPYNGCSALGVEFIKFIGVERLRFEYRLQ